MSKILSWKLFEAFKSSLISNTLKFIKEDKKKFLSFLTIVCDKLDFPMSELNDGYFKYLPKKWALDYKKESSGEDLVLIKFWFDSDGKFLCVSTPQNTKETLSGSLSLDDTFSKDLSDYEVIKRVYASDVVNLPSGVLIKFKPPAKRSAVVGITFKSPADKRMYLVQDEYDGSSPRDYELFRKKWGRYSWVIETNDDLGEAYLIKDIHQSGEKRISWIGSDVNLVKDAHFAIVMDLEDLKSGLSVSDIKKRREESRKGSLHFMSEEELKKINIEKILSKLKLDPNKPENVFRRIIGYDYGFIFLSNGISLGNIKKVSEDLLDIISTNEDEREELISDLKENLKIIYRETRDYQIIIRDNLKKVMPQPDEEEMYPDELKDFIEEYLKLNKLMSDYLNFLDKKSIIDIEYMISQINYFNNLVETKVLSDYNGRFIKNLNHYLMNKDFDIYDFLVEIVSQKSIQSLKDINKLLKRITK